MAFARFVGCMSLTIDTRNSEWEPFLANVRTIEETIFQPEHLNKITNPDLKHLALGIKMLL